jgi:hypothetical protein
MKYLAIFTLSCALVTAAETIVPIEIGLNSTPKNLQARLLQSLEVYNKKTWNFSPALLSKDLDENFRAITMPRNLQEKENNTPATVKDKKEWKIINIYKVDDSTYIVLSGNDSMPVSGMESTSIWLKGENSWYCSGTFAGVFQAIEKLNLDRFESGTK